MIKDAETTAKVVFVSVDRSRHPFVISIRPSNKKARFCGRIEKRGERVSITIKKIVIIQPTDNIDRVEFVTMSEMSKLDLF